MNVPALRFKEFSAVWQKESIQHFIDNKSILSHLDGNHGALYPKSSEFSKTGIPYISANDFVNGRVDFSKCKYLPLEKAKLFKKGVAKNGDVLFAHNATVGPCAILGTKFDYVVLSTTATYFRCDLNKINNSYLYNFFQSDYFVSQYSSIMSQSTRNQVPITTQRTLFITLPEIEEQTKIANFLTAVDEKITQLTQKHDLLTQYKKGVMQQIFSQELRFKDDDGGEFPDWDEASLESLLDYEQPTKYLVSSTEYSDLYTTPVLTAGKTFVLGYTNETKGIFNEGLPVIIFDDFTTAFKYVAFPFKAKSSAMKILRIKDSTNSIKYIYEAMELIDFPSGDEHKRYWISEYSKVTIPLPCQKEQIKIANFLTAIDDKITATQAQLDAVKQYKQGLLQQMFV